MGLGPLQAIYQARFMKYLEARGLAETSDRRVWHSVVMVRWMSRNQLVLLLEQVVKA